MRDFSPQSELKILRSIVAFQANPAGQMAKRKWYPIAGNAVGAVLLSLGYLSVGFSDINPRWSVVIAALGGVAIAWAAVMSASLRSWPAILDLIDPEKLRKRQSDLESQAPTTRGQ